MFRTIRGRVTINVILIVVAMIIILASTILTVMGNKLTDKMELELQLRSDRYANEINAWFAEEKMLVTDAARAVEAAGNVDSKTVQSVVDTYYQGRPELLNLYLGKEDHSFYQGNPEATTPEGYDPCERRFSGPGRSEKDDGAELVRLDGAVQEPVLSDDMFLAHDLVKTAGPQPGS